MFKGQKVTNNKPRTCGTALPNAPMMHIGAVFPRPSTMSSMPWAEEAHIPQAEDVNSTIWLSEHGFQGHDYTYEFLLFRNAPAHCQIQGDRRSVVRGSNTVSGALRSF